MRLALVLVQLIVQAGWSLYSHLSAPSNWFLSSLQVGLLLVTLTLLSDKDEHAFFLKGYIALWTIPLAYIAFIEVTRQLEVQNRMLEAAKLEMIKPLFEGSSRQYKEALEKYLVSQVIPPVFWILEKVMGLFNDEQN
jgi:hypothetical protein